MLGEPTGIPSGLSREKGPSTEVREHIPPLSPREINTSDYFNKVLQSDNHAEVDKAFKGAQDIGTFRSKTGHFKGLSNAVEAVHGLHQQHARGETSSAQLNEAITQALDRCVVDSSHTGRMKELFNGLMDESYVPESPDVKNCVDKLRKNNETGALFAPNVSLEEKARIIENLKRSVETLKNRDKRDKKKVEKEREEGEPPPTTPPEDSDESRPGMDEMERNKEGEPPTPVWSIEPSWSATKYFKRQSFSAWNEEGKKWVESKRENYPIEPVKKLEEDEIDKDKGRYNITMTSSIRTNTWIRIPLTYTHDFSELDCGDAQFNINRDLNGDVRVFIHGTGEEVPVTVTLGPRPNPKKAYGLPKGVEKPTPPDFDVSGCSEETRAKLGEVRNIQGGNLKKARALQAYVKKRITYSNDSSFNDVYSTDQRGYAAAIDHHKMADCDVGNTYFAALCANLNIPVRHCVGDSVKGNPSCTHSGSGHAWTEVWVPEELRWELVDATSAGDPNLEEEGQEGGDPGEMDGDDVWEEALVPTDEELEKLTEELKDAEHKLSFNEHERRIAEVSGVELQTARDILNEIQAARELTLPDGRTRILDALSNLFSVIVEERKKEVMVEEGPFTPKEGGTILDPREIVTAYLGVQSGEKDVRAYEKFTEEEEKEHLFGGFDLYLIGDQSGSMGFGKSETTGETLWETQRKVTYLILHALHSFGTDLDNANIQDDKILDVRTGAWSFGTEGWDTPVVKNNKPFSNKYNEMDQVGLWHGLSGTRGGNADVEALQEVYLSIIRDQEARKAAGDNKQRSRIVISCSDGAPESPAEVRAWAYFIGLTGVEGEEPLEFVETKKEAEEGEEVVSYGLTPESQKYFDEKVEEMKQEVAEHNFQSKEGADQEVSKKSTTHMIGMGITDSGSRVGPIYSTSCSKGIVIQDPARMAEVIGREIVERAVEELLSEEAKVEAKSRLNNILASFGSEESV